MPGAHTAEGDPNSGIVAGDAAVMVIDTQATSVMAQDVIRRIREVTDKPTRYVVRSHYDTVRVLGVSPYGADHVITSQDARNVIVEALVARRYDAREGTCYLVRPDLHVCAHWRSP